MRAGAASVEWREVAGCPGYWVSSDGRVRGRAGRLMKATPNEDGYPRVTMCLPGGGKRSRAVHVLVCEAFHGPRPLGHHAAHRDGTRTNSRADNLRWATPVENARDRFIHGTQPRGEQNHSSKLTADQVREMRVHFSMGARICDLSRRYGLPTSTICTIVYRKKWTHI